MAVVNKLKELQTLMKKLKTEMGTGPSTVVAVGYTAAYALHVHENLEMPHPNGGQAKFLTDAVAAFAPDLDEHVKTSLKAGLTMKQALVMAGLRIQRDSQELVPVDTGNLKGSAFTRVIRS